jgi:hypothetical protein
VAQSHDREYALLLFCDPVAGHESEFNVWWPEYLRRLAAVPGVVGVEDFRRAPIRLRDGAQALPAHLGYFSIAAPDLAAVVGNIAQQMKDGRIPLSPAVDMTTLRDFSYRREGHWTHEPPAVRGGIFMQTVLSNASSGQDAEYRHWFQQTHGPQLVAVPGVYEVEFGARTDVDLIAGEAAASPMYLSAMRFETPAILEFKAGLELAARSSVATTTSYDIQGTWRETYRRVGDPVRSRGRK